MATLDIFKSSAFGMVSITEALNNVPFQPGLITGLKLFTPKPVRTVGVSVEEKNGTLSLIQTSERGAPLAEADREKRKIRDFRTRRIAKHDSLRADEIQSIRAFGSETELMQVVDEVNQRMNGPTGLMRDVELTWENMALGAIQGIVTDADASVIYNFYDEFGISAASEIDFDLDAASPASGAVRKKCTQVVRQMQKAASGGWIPGRTYVMALCGDAFWDDLTAHTEVRQTYLNTQEARQLRDGLAYETFNYGGITWINYRGTDDGSTVAVGTDKAKFFPVNGNGVFQVAYSPAETFDYVNTPGLPVYGMVIPDEKRNAFVDLEVYSYPLFMCTRPAMLQSAKRT
ncbi:MAG: major capsid protein [Rhodocyclales bacterium]|nr:major capsid protein [Rhodocyclales bacterium]